MNVRMYATMCIGRHPEQDLCHYHLASTRQFGGVSSGTELSGRVVSPSEAPDQLESAGD